MWQVPRRHKHGLIDSLALDALAGDAIHPGANRTWTCHGVASCLGDLWAATCATSTQDSGFPTCTCEQVL
ncbi:hypothetical protein POL58_34190 [Nannocystis sp. ncelm1]|uniref:Uncharacterized protein n=1 Tax=Nannocystis radixulma TaxID=2995305 RepID=A0ABT5BH44_9BACT|nr:hypothetical protein [Nannocystis radixulma]